MLAPFCAKARWRRRREACGAHALARIDQLGNRTTVVYDAIGRQSATINPLGHRATQVYDALHRVVATQDQLGHRITAPTAWSGR